MKRPVLDERADLTKRPVVVCSLARPIRLINECFVRVLGSDGIRGADALRPGGETNVRAGFGRVRETPGGPFRPHFVIRESANQCRESMRSLFRIVPKTTTSRSLRSFAQHPKGAAQSLVGNVIRLPPVTFCLGQFKGDAVWVYEPRRWGGDALPSPPQRALGA
ncbi:MAG: hypothetical protein CM15mP125_2610 [Gammaproteobacteria bacterium]|nr:MAG: hypothetical protein CM15mP125_2610 [Gammaproteobacteria bacterium]